MSCSIIIPTYNRLVYTRICLQMLATTLSDRNDTEIIAVDNGSTDGTPAYLRSLGDQCRTVLNSRNLGFAAACNRGADVAEGENLVFLNNDTVPMDKWLDPLESLLRNEQIGAVGSKLLFPNDTIQHAGVVFSEQRIPVHMYYLFPSSYQPADEERDYQAVTGACLAMRRSLFLSLGGFDEQYVNSFEDIDLCLRARAQGYRVVYCPRSVLYHFESASEGRHSNDDANLSLFLKRWGNAVDLDETRWYRRDGFSSPPRLPIRMLSQAVAQLTFDRLRGAAAADSSSRLVPATGPAGTPRASIDPAATTEVAYGLLPEPAVAGTDFSVNLQLRGLRVDAAEAPVAINYEWRLPRTGAALLRGHACYLDRRIDEWHVEQLQLGVPTIPGSYALTWILQIRTGQRSIGQQVVCVAPRFGFESRAQLPEFFEAGEQHRVIVMLKNTGAETWLPHGGFRLSYHWFDQTGRKVVVWDGARAPILERVAFGHEIVLEVSVGAPALPGRYQLVWDPIHEGEFWFSSVGVSCPSTAIEVHPTMSGSSVPKRSPSDISDVAERFGLESRRMGRRIAALEVALEGHDIEQCSNAVRARDDVIGSLQREIETYRQDMWAASLELQRKDADIRELTNLIGEIAQGRVMRLLNGFNAWRKGGSPRGNG
jgi:GT2 family glycosyltransferase